jgi:uncharacterized protein YecT (DUF1311 family)
MSQGLTQDVRASEHELSALDDSLARRLGDTVSVLLKQADASWEEYRKRECAAVRLAFEQGSIAPIAQLECWVELTDDRRHFLGGEYDFTRQERSRATSRPP